MEDILDKFPPLRPTIPKLFVEDYTKIVIDELSLSKYVKRFNAKKELTGIVERFESKLNRIKPPT